MCARVQHNAHSCSHPHMRLFQRCGPRNKKSARARVANIYIIWIEPSYGCALKCYPNKNLLPAVHLEMSLGRRRRRGLPNNDDDEDARADFIYACRSRCASSPIRGTADYHLQALAVPSKHTTYIYTHRKRVRATHRHPQRDLLGAHERWTADACCARTVMMHLQVRPAVSPWTPHGHGHMTRKHAKPAKARARTHI